MLYGDNLPMGVSAKMACQVPEVLGAAKENKAYPVKQDKKAT